MRYFITSNLQTLEVVSAPFEIQPENSLPYLANNFVKPIFDKYPNPTAVIEGATALEIIALTDLREADEDKIDYQNQLDKAQNLFVRHQTRLIRRRKKSLITNARIKTVKTLLVDTYFLINLGFLDLALDKINLIAVQTNADVQAEITWLKDLLTANQ